MGIHGLGFFYGDDAFVTDFFHSVGNQAADFFIPGGDGSNLGFGSFGHNLLGGFLQCFNNRVNRCFDTFFQDHGIGAGHYVLHAFADHGLGQQGGGGGTVAGYVVGLGGNFFYQLGAHVFKGVFQLNVTGDGHAVINNRRRTEFFLQYHIAAFGAQGNFYRISQCVNAAFQAAAGFFVKQNLFCHIDYLL